jgi:ankyrin repeat protein
MKCIKHGLTHFLKQYLIIVLFISIQMLYHGQESQFYILSGDGTKCLNEVSSSESSAIKHAINESKTVDYSKWLVESFKPSSSANLGYWKAHPRDPFWAFFSEGLLFPYGDKVFNYSSEEKFGPIIMDTHSTYRLALMDDNETALWKKKLSVRMELPVHPFATELGLMFYGNKTGNGYNLYIIKKSNGETLLELPLKWQGDKTGVDYMDVNSISAFYIDGFVIFDGLKMKSDLETEGNKLAKDDKCKVVIDLRPMTEKIGTDTKEKAVFFSGSTVSKPPKPRPVPKGRKGATALVDACRTGDLETVKRLVEGGVPVNGKDKNRYPISAAVEKCKYEVIKYLLSKGADPNIKDKEDGPALVEAINSCYLRSTYSYDECFNSIKCLLENGADPNLSTDYSHYTPAKTAISCGFVEILELLIDKGADIKVPVNFEIVWAPDECNTKEIMSKRTLLMFAASGPGFEQSPKIVSMLIKHGADVNERDGCGMTALAIAKMIYFKSGKDGRGYKEIIKVLEDAGGVE